MTSSSTFPSSASVPANLNDVGKRFDHSTSSNYREGCSLASSPKKKMHPKKTKEQEESFIEFLNTKKKPNLVSSCATNYVSLKNLVKKNTKLILMYI